MAARRQLGLGEPTKLSRAIVDTRIPEYEMGDVFTDQGKLEALQRAADAHVGGMRVRLAGDHLWADCRVRPANEPYAVTLVDIYDAQFMWMGSYEDAIAEIDWEQPFRVLSAYECGAAARRLRKELS